MHKQTITSLFTDKKPIGPDQDCFDYRTSARFPLLERVKKSTAYGRSAFSALLLS